MGAMVGLEVASSPGQLEYVDLCHPDLASSITQDAERIITQQVREDIQKLVILDVFMCPRVLPNQGDPMDTIFRHLG